MIPEHVSCNAYQFYTLNGGDIPPKNKKDPIYPVPYSGLS